MNSLLRLDIHVQIIVILLYLAFRSGNKIPYVAGDDSRNRCFILQRNDPGHKKIQAYGGLRSRIDKVVLEFPFGIERVIHYGDCT